MLRTADLELPPPMAEWRKNSKEIASARKAVAPEARKVRAAFIKAQLPNYERSDVRWQRAQSTLTAAVERRTLLSNFLLRMENGESVTVGAVLADPARFNGARFYDPLAVLMRLN